MTAEQETEARMKRREIDERCGHRRCEHAACDGKGCAGCTDGLLPWCWAGCHAHLPTSEGGAA